MALDREHIERAPEREGKGPESGTQVWVNILEVGELSACSGRVVEEGAQVILLTNEVETSKHLELSE